MCRVFEHSVPAWRLEPKWLLNLIVAFLLTLFLVSCTGEFCTSETPTANPFSAISVYEQTICVATGSNVYCGTTNDKGHDSNRIPGAGRLFSFQKGQTSDTQRDILLDTREGTCLGLPNGKGTFSIMCAQWLVRGLYPLPSAHDLDISTGDHVTSVVCLGTNAGILCTRFFSQHTRRVLTHASIRRVAGGWHHVCGINNEGRILCSELDTEDILRHTLNSQKGHGCGQVSPPSSGKYVEITSGAVHTCALSESGTVRCWGAGDRLTQNRCFSPFDQEEEFDHGQSRQPPGKFTTIVAGKFHTCALRPNQTVECWGANEHGETNAPEKHFLEIEAGGESSCGVTTEGEFLCWGDASGLGRQMQQILRASGIINGSTQSE